MSREQACPEFADRLVDLSDGDLSAAEWEMVEAHVATCAACRAELSRLDASLAALQEGIVAPQSVGRRISGRRRAALVAAGTAAAILLALGVANLVRSPPERGRESLAGAGSPMIENRVPPKTEGPLASPMSSEAALQQIALIEQQARLEMSLALMPDDEWYAESRTANEELLVRLREAAATLQNPAVPRPRTSGEPL